MMPHRFDQSNERSHAYDDADWVDAAYRGFFGRAVEIEVIAAGDSAEQRAGIDRIVTMPSQKRFNVDDKFRDEDWGDIALERFSDRDRKTPGWVQKLNSSLSDFINYAVVPTKTCTFLARQPLWCAWRKYGHEWIARAYGKEPGFKMCLADNERWVTESIAVPRDVLFAAMNDAIFLRPEFHPQVIQGGRRERRMPPPPQREWWEDIDVEIPACDGGWIWETA